MCIVVLSGMTHGTTLGSIIMDGVGTILGMILGSMAILGMDGILGTMDGMQDMVLITGITTIIGIHTTMQVITDMQAVTITLTIGQVALMLHQTVGSLQAMQILMVV
jgi:hypothetical protein